MRQNKNLESPKLLWYLGRGTIYFLILFITLIIVVSLIFFMLYYSGAASLFIDFLGSITSTIFVLLIVITVVILLVPATLGSWLLIRARSNQRHLEDQRNLDSHLLDVATDSIMVHDIEGNCIYANQATFSSLGYDLDDMSATDLCRLNTRELAKFIKTNSDELFEKGEIQFESAYIHKDNSLMPVEVYSRVVKLHDQKLILSTVRDITERKRTEEELKESSEKLRKAMDGTIKTIALTTEIRDPYTAGHQQRVAKLAHAIAAELNLSPEQLEGIRVAGSLHDIGKIYVPAEILSKPGKLRQSELNLLKDHAQVGYDLLKTIEFPWPVAQIVLQHHERVDGSGYPHGLDNDNILIEAKILGVADVVEAMSSHRPYRPAYSLEKALLEIIQNRGILYAADVVDICVTLINDKGFKFS